MAATFGCCSTTARAPRSASCSPWSIPNPSNNPLLLRTESQKDASAETKADDEGEEREEEQKYYCARCHRLVTDGRWRLAMYGDHEHTFLNPAGLIFHILCFKDADGARGLGVHTREYSWFQGYGWRTAACLGCGQQLGWEFAGAESPRLFFGFIRERLTTEKPD